MSSSNHPSPLPRLQYKLGGRNSGDQIFNGYFFDAEFRLGDSGWLGESDAEIKDFFNAMADKIPNPNHEDLDNNKVIIPVKEDNQFNVNQTSKPADSAKIVTSYENVNEYSIFGWTKLADNTTVG